MAGTLGVKLARIAIVAAVFAAWETLSRTGMVNPRLLPSASDTLAMLWELLQRASVRNDLAVTASEVLTAFILAVPVGAAIGFAIAENRYFAEVAKPLLFFAFSIPKSIFLPMFILVFGVGFSQKVGFGFFSTIFIVIMSTTTAVESVKVDHLQTIDPQLVLAARSMGATLTQRLIRVIIPAAIPTVLSGLRVGGALVIVGVVVSEMLISSAGIGYLISRYRTILDSPHVFAGVLSVLAMAIAFNAAIKWIERKASIWQTGTRAGQRAAEDIRVAAIQPATSRRVLNRVRSDLVVR